MNAPARRAILLFAVCGPSCLAAQGRDAPLAAGDRVLIKVWTDSVFADTARVSADGIVILPRLGPLSIAGVRATMVSDSIRRAYARLITPAAVEITPLIRTTVIGDVRRPAPYFLEPGATLRDAVASAGGITEIGRTGRVVLVRDSRRTRVSDWQSRTDDGTQLQSGDVVLVERESWFKRNVFTVVSGVGVVISLVLSLTRG